MPKMRIAVTGGGFMGLAAAWEASVNGGAEVVLYEKDDLPGGLARTFEIGGEEFERYHHFISADDSHLLEMAGRLGVSGEISWRKTRIAYFIGDRVAPFTTAFDLMKFPGLSLADKFRFGMSMMKLTRLTDWEPLESTPARDWIIARQGRNCYNVLWAHLMEMKFAGEVGIIPLSWFWSRSRRRASNRKLLGDSERFGVFNRSASSMAEAFVKQISGAGGVFRNVEAVSGIERKPDGRIKIASASSAEDFDRAIVTVPLPAFVKMTPGLPAEYVKSLELIKYAGIINMVVALDRPLTPYFWLNVSDRDVPFPGVIEMTHLRPGPKGLHLAYIPNYVYSDHPDFEVSDKELFERYFPSLKRINPSANVLEYRVFRDRYADPYYSLNYSKVMPAPATPVEGVFLANTAQVYPVTRSLNNSIGWGIKVAKMAYKSSIST